MDLIDVHNTFSPGQEIMRPEQFAGRKANLAQAVRALCRSGSSLLVYGERGVGKTSFVEMVKLLAQGQVELVYRYGLKALMPPDGFQYKVASVECDGDVETSEQVLQRLLTSPEGFSNLVSSRLARREITEKDTFGISLLEKLFTYSSAFDEKKVLEEFKEESVFELFTNVVQSIVANVLMPNEGLLIVIDEFDRVKEKQKLSSLLKTLSKNRVKFLISGIGQNYFDLVEDHASVDRQLYQGKIEIKPMTEEEIFQLFSLAQKHNNELIEFQNSLVTDIASKSFGYPYYVQLFGQLCLDRYVDISGSAKGAVTTNHLNDGLKQFAEMEPKLERIYNDIVSAVPERELMLKGMANLITKDIRQREVFRYCENRGVQNPKQILATLLSFKEPEVLLRIDKERVTFHNRLFRIFAAVRDPIFLDVDDETGIKIPTH